jgi:hypothetical protein
MIIPLEMIVLSTCQLSRKDNGHASGDVCVVSCIRKKSNILVE